LLFHSVVNEKTKNFFLFSLEKEGSHTLKTVDKGLSHDIIGELSHRTPKSVYFKFSQPKPTSPSPVDNDNQIFS